MSRIKRVLYAIVLIIFTALVVSYVAVSAEPTLAQSFAITMSVILFAFFMLCLIIALDIVNDREKTRELDKATARDPLTGLGNDSSMERGISAFLTKNRPSRYSLVCLDIAEFHRFNVMFGYAAGDYLLKIIADVLRADYRCAVRSFGDVFLFLDETSSVMIEGLKYKLYDAIESDLGRQYVQVISFKFGVCPLGDFCKPYRLIRDNVMFALKYAKKNPKQNAFAFYNSELQKESVLQKDIEMNMLHALSKEEFQLYIQPKCNLLTGECGGGEALVRWSSDQLGFVTPNKFIPLFEKNGFIVEIDFFILTSVFNMIETHIARGMRLLPISVNQSKITISFPNYLERLRNLAKKYHVPLSLISIEITESAMEANYETVVSAIYEIREMGFRIDMDDFGSGYSSLNTLREIPVDTLKIDREFLNEADTSERSKAIIKNIINLSKDLGISVVCEGVETGVQYDFLRSISCDYAQGYYYARPMTTNDYENRFVIDSEVEIID
ncbi:MAG: GGDEF domain-containing protein [Clostridiales bacterium]|jgi:EAL domain-containing protein (putative c-di-GMP-specific phosphodiesterase class I)/GGDEF domain-containing protein|nr:GGDEF domain-containing protein [Clostridiales bacterium]